MNLTVQQTVRKKELRAPRYRQNTPPPPDQRISGYRLSPPDRPVLLRTPRASSSLRHLLSLCLESIQQHSYWLNTSGSLISIVKEIPPGRVTAIHHELRSESEVSAGDTTGESLPGLWFILLRVFGLLIFLALGYFNFIVRPGLQRSLNILRLSAGFATQHNARRIHIVSADRATARSTSLVPWEEVTP
ncbi:hypothetical protein N7455_003193 [Penicillium solitum]|uniref:uncharacterized protein n=1 Tax=Penicillium solitum TaxID=60172 RepID=UPI0017D584EE|nr:hypothetical protein HAV15_006709 [Penicillium sp. str. \